MAYSLTRRQEDVLRFIAGYEAAFGQPPLQREIAKGIGGPVGSATCDRIDALVERGHLRRTCEPSRNIRVTVPISFPRAPDGAPLYAVPGFGDAG